MTDPHARPRNGLRRLSGHAAVYVGSAALNALLPFLMLPLVTRWLGPSDFGIFAAFLAAANLLTVVIGLSTHGLISVMYFREGPETLPSQAGAAVGIAVSMTIILMIVLVAMPPNLVGRTGLPRGWLFVVVLTGLGLFLMSVALAVYQTRRQPLFFAALQIGFGLISTALTIFLVGVADMDWAGRAAAQTAAAICIGGGGLIALTFSHAISWDVTKWPIRSTLIFALPLLPHVAGAAVITSIDRIALSVTMGEKALGHYFLAAQIGSLFVVGAAAVNQAWQPWLFEQLGKGTAESRRVIVTMTYAALGALALAAAVVAIASDLIARLIGGAEFAESATYLSILSPAFAAHGAYFFFTNFLMYEKRTGLQSMITASVAIFQTMLTFYLGWRNGAEGVAYATLISFVLYWLSTWRAAHSVIPMPWAQWPRLRWS